MLHLQHETNVTTHATPFIVVIVVVGRTAIAATGRRRERRFPSITAAPLTHATQHTAHS